MTVPAVGAAVAHLAWLTPRATSLVALARRSAVSAWDELHADPASFCLSSVNPRFATIRLPRDSFITLAMAMRRACPHSARTAGGHADWAEPSLTPIYRTALSMASVAWPRGEGRRMHRMRLGGRAARARWAGSLAAVDARSAIDCLQAGGSEETQLSHWGLDASAIARRLGRRWQLPALRDDPRPTRRRRTASAVGADGRLLRIVPRRPYRCPGGRRYSFPTWQRLYACSRICRSISR